MTFCKRQNFKDSKKKKKNEKQKESVVSGGWEGSHE